MMDIKVDGLVKIALKVRLERMKLKYQRKQGNDPLTEQEEEEKREDLWTYLKNEVVDEFYKKAGYN